MKKAISLLTAAILVLITVLPVGASPATGDEALNSGFDFGLATTLIITICSVLTAAVLIVAIYLARKNRNN